MNAVSLSKYLTTPIKKLSLLIFDKTFSITYVLFLVSLFVCIFSVACSCSSQIESRGGAQTNEKIGHKEFDFKADAF